MTLFKTPRLLTWFYPRRTWGFSLDKKQIYLTFDDGPTSELTEWILDFLEKENIKATFFCVGANILQNPELFQKIKEQGHQVANHTMQHEKGTTTKWADYKKSVQDCGELVGNTIFRPPYGRLSAFNSARLSQKYKIIMWSWLSYDYDSSVPVSTILKSAQEDIRSGDILVLHDNQKVDVRLKEILPELVQILKSKNFSFEKIT